MRFDADLVRRLETAAKGHATTLSQEVRERLIASFAETSLADFHADWLRRLRDAVEACVPKEKIEEAWGLLRDIEVVFAGTYTASETKLSLLRLLRYPRVRELLRGAPTLPEHKPSQQERGRGGKA
jgi:hypothetical protein